MIELVVFDMAGTTIDEQNVVYKTIHQTIVAAGYEVSLETVLLFAAGKEKLQAIKDVLTHHTGTTPSDEVAKAIHENFEDALDVAYEELTPLPMPGIESVIKALKHRDIPIVLNTGYKRSVAKGLLRQLGWKEGNEYDLLVTADDVKHGRPQPDMILKAMKQFGIDDAAAVAKVGDSIVDIEEGQNAGCGISAGITTGAQTREQLLTANPTHVFDSLDELLDYID